ncbi:MAG TPA: hypothetical protein VFN51_02500 [Candidatus Saccharimonadales bacterium]|nr:hypothetical protein [Candidatus Saccharimonadales bacterium]
MSDEAQSKLASTLAAIVGAYIGLSPIWTTMTEGVMVSAIATGSVIFLASLWQMATKSTLPSWINGLASIWLIIGAIIFGAYSFSVISQIVAGVAVFFLASWDGAEVSNYNNRHYGATS